MDNYYTSPELLLALYKKVNACGTARANRKYYPKDLIAAKNVDTGYYDFRSCGPLLACVWKDKRISFLVAYFCLSFGSLIIECMCFAEVPQ